MYDYSGAIITLNYLVVINDIYRIYHAMFIFNHPVAELNISPNAIISVSATP